MEERSADPVLQRRQHGHGASSGKRQMIKVTVQPGGHQLKLRIWSSTLEVKQQMGARLGGHVSWMRLLHNNVELLNSQLLIDLVPNVKPPRRGSRDSSGGAANPSRSLTFWLKVQNPHDFASGSYLHTWGIGTNAAGAAGEQLLTSAQQGLQIGLAPQLSLEGSGGTYLLRDTQKRPVAAFKPRDEEPFAPNNPRGLAGKMGQPGIHPNVASGDAHIREVLAFRLDWGGFASVPCTLQVEGRHPALHVNSLQPLSRYGAKVGSLQAWVKHDDTASDRGTATFPVHEVHKIAILDMRLLNSDRHDSNLLVVDRPSSDGGTTCELVPIDHGGCLPSLPEVNWFNWCWMEWPQMKVPLSASDAAYVASLDVKAEEKLLTELGVPARPRRALYCSTMLLQRGVAAGLSLLEVAKLMCRDEEETPSELERLWTQAERLAYSALHNHRLRGCADSFSSAPASRGNTPGNAPAAACAASPAAAPGAAATATATATAIATQCAEACVELALTGPGRAGPGVVISTHRLQPRLDLRIELLRLLLLALLLLVLPLLRRPRRVRVGPPHGAPADAVSGGAADAACRDARHDLAATLRQRHAADARRAEVRVRLVDGAQGADDLEAGLAPLGDERGVHHLLAHEELVQLAADLLLLVIQVVDEPVALVVNAVDWPRGLRLALPLVRVVHGLAEALLELQQRALDGRPALGLALVLQAHA
mmetsp:Transcript_26223/g.66558  ORF Transcript_26223/g.66558 Transcript_26223/m.66558 type:complete len:707 (+) Transcript_26223:65-2185(+)